MKIKAHNTGRYMNFISPRIKMTPVKLVSMKLHLHRYSPIRIYRILRDWEKRLAITCIQYTSRFRDSYVWPATRSIYPKFLDHWRQTVLVLIIMTQILRSRTPMLRYQTCDVIVFLNKQSYCLPSTVITVNWFMLTSIHVNFKLKRTCSCKGTHSM